MKLKEEKIGELYVFSEVIFVAIIPIIINYSGKIMPAVLFAGITSLIAGIVFFFISLAKRNLSALLNKKVLFYSLAITLFIIVLPSIFIFTGSKYTSGINTAIFMQMEIFFAIIICRLFLKEKMTRTQITGTILTLIGATAILYSGDFAINKGDLLIIAGTVFYPFGNIYAKKALKIVDPYFLIFFRSFLGGIVLIAISFIYEDSLKLVIPSIEKNFTFIMLTGIFIAGFSKLLWYEGLKRVNVTKATSILMSYPALSLIFAIIFLHETPTIYQIIGLFITLTGAYFITRMTEQKNRSLIENQLG